MSSTTLSNVNGLPQMPTNNGCPHKPITEIITNGFFSVDRRWTVTYWNKAAEKLLGISSKDIIGRNLWEEFAGIIPLNFYTVYHKAFLQNIPVHFEEYWGEMGAWFDVITYYCDDTLSVSFKTVNRPSGPAHTEKQLKILNELYRFITEVTNDCLWELDLQTKELFWIDGGHKRVFGYPIENAIIPQSFWISKIHPDDRDRVIARLNKIIEKATVTIWEEEYRFQKYNGDYAHVHDRGHIIYNEEKLAVRMIGATQDISARKTAEAQLLESEKRLSLITRETVNAMIIADAGGKITWVNNAFTKMTEYKLEEVIGRNLGSFLQGKETIPSTLEFLREKIKTQQLFDCQIANYSKSGRRYWMHVQGQPILDNKGDCEWYFAIQTDITERVLLENKLAEERQNKHREITSAVITAQENERFVIGKELHDNLNQVLGTAKLYIEMAKTEDDKRDIYLEKSGGLISNVIEEIRKISKNWVMPGMNLLGIFDSIKNLIDDLMIVNPVKIEFHHYGVDENDLDEKLGLTIFRIVQEQVKNILKHADASFASIDLSRQKNMLVLLITDNGKGCKITNVNKGVGLINIRSRADINGGNVTVHSKPGEGYELKVMLPLNSPQFHS